MSGISNENKKALLVEVIGEDAVIEGVDFDFEQSTYINVFGGKTITITPADRLAAADSAFADCVVVHCTDESIKQKGRENILAAILATPSPDVPMIYGKALVMHRLAGSVSGFELFTDEKLNRLIDTIDTMAQNYDG